MYVCCTCVCMYYTSRMEDLEVLVCYFCMICVVNPPATRAAAATDGHCVQAVDETQERLELVGIELDDLCRRLDMGDSFQVHIYI